MDAAMESAMSIRRSRRGELQELEGLFALLLEIPLQEELAAFTVGLVRGGPEGVESHAFHYGNLLHDLERIESLDAPGDQTLWPIGSISHTYLAALLALLAHERPGLFNESVYPYIAPYLDPGSPPSHLQEITFLHLATHTSGLRLHLNPEDGPLDPAQVFHRLATTEVLFPPGGGYARSHLDPVLLLYALASLDGPVEPLARIPSAAENLLVKRIFRPLGLHSTRIYRPDLLSSIPYGYDQRGQIVRQVASPGLSLGTGILTTSLDFLRWLQYHMGLIQNPHLPPGLLPQLHCPTFMVHHECRRVLLSPGWFVHPSGYATFLVQDGGMDSTTMVRFSPVSRCGAFVFGNCPCNAQEILDVALSYLSGDEIMPDA